VQAKEMQTSLSSSQHVSRSQADMECDPVKITPSTQDSEDENAKQTHPQEQMISELREAENLAISQSKSGQEGESEQSKLLEKTQHEVAAIHGIRDELYAKHVALEERYSQHEASSKTLRTRAISAEAELAKTTAALNVYKAKAAKTQHDIEKQGEESRAYLTRVLQLNEEQTKKLKSQNTELADQVYKTAGEVQYATVDQMRLLMDDWYHESANFCPEFFFEYPDMKNKRHRELFESRDEWRVIREEGPEFFYSLMERYVLHTSLMNTIKYILSGADENDSTAKSLHRAIAELDQIIADERTERGPTGERPLSLSISRD
jgi:hypothetical protein